MRSLLLMAPWSVAWGAVARAASLTVPWSVAVWRRAAHTIEMIRLEPHPMEVVLTAYACKRTHLTRLDLTRLDLA